MSYRSRGARSRLGLWLAVALVVPLASLYAGHNLFNNSAVGGISIDPTGVVRDADIDSLKMRLEQLRKDLDAPAPEINTPVEMRKISLRQLEAAIRDAITNNLGQLPEEIQFLAGIQRIQYVFVYPEKNDIVLAGPGEGWRVDDGGNIVGVTTGRPVLRLDDLLVALRFVHEAREVGISCSIDPTPEGLQRLNEVLAQQRSSGQQLNPARLEPVLKEALGPQTITLTGVPPTSHFARVMVAADYHMKRLAMNVVPSPVRGLPSYLDLAKNSNELQTSNPRWWLACNYDSIAKSENGLAWELRGPGVKTLTEDNLFTEEGTVRANRGKTSPLAQKWADQMTERYDELSGRNPVFGELRNLMDMCVVAAIIEKYNLRSAADIELPLLYDNQSELALENWNAPKSVAPVCSFVRARRGWVVSASGGVQVDSWQVADKTVDAPELADLHRQAATADSASWWWN